MKNKREILAKINQMSEDELVNLVADLYEKEEKVDWYEQQLAMLKKSSFWII